MTRRLAWILVMSGFLSACGDGHSPTSPSRPTTPVPTPDPPPAQVPPAPLSGTMTVSSSLTKSGNYQYIVQIELTEGAGVPKTISSVDVAGDDRWGDYPPIGHFDSRAWGSSNVVPANGTSKSQPLLAIDEAPLMYYPSLRATVTFSDGSSVGSGTVSIDAVSPPTPEPPPGATFKVSGIVWNEHHIPTAGVGVEIQDGPNAGRKATTRRDGTYALDGLTTGLFAIEFSKDGYQKTSYSTVLKSNLQISRELQLPR